MLSDVCTRAGKNLDHRPLWREVIFSAEFLPERLWAPFRDAYWLISSAYRVKTNGRKRQKCRKFEPQKICSAEQTALCSRQNDDENRRAISNDEPSHFCSFFSFFILFVFYDFLFRIVLARFCFLFLLKWGFGSLTNRLSLLLWASGRGSNAGENVLCSLGRLKREGVM